MALESAKSVIRRLSLPACEEEKPLTPDIEIGDDGTNTEVKRRKGKKYIPKDWDDSLPYGGKVYLARRKKPLSIFCILILALCVIIAVTGLIYCIFWTEHLHFHITKLHAHLGRTDAQAAVGHRLLHGKGVEKNHTEAMMWLHKAALSGHAHAAYNVAVGHMQGMQTELQPGDAKKYIKHAADKGVPEAIVAYEELCSVGRCDF